MALLEAPFARYPEARRIAASVRSVLCGRRQTARLVYASQIERPGWSWFQLSAARFASCGEPHVAVTNEEVTIAKEAEHALGQVAGRLLALQEEERRCIAEELHDSTVQHLVAIGLSVMRLKSQSAGTTDPVLQDIEASLDEACKELRTLTYLLHPPRLESNGLHRTLQDFVDGFVRRSGLHAKLRINREVNVPSFALQHTILRIVQESLANVHRHADASSVSIDLRCIRQRLHLIVRDDGRGIEGADRDDASGTSTKLRSGVGIPGIRARLRQFGGEFDPHGARGSKLHAMAPLASAVAMQASDRRRYRGSPRRSSRNAGRRAKRPMTRILDCRRSRGGPLRPSLDHRGAAAVAGRGRGHGRQGCRAQGPS